MTNKNIGINPNYSDAVQILFRDGLNHSIIMANLSYSRLRADLLALSNNDYLRRKENKETMSEEVVITHQISALSNAWQVIDSVNRLRDLLRQAPGIKHGVEYELFVRNTEKVVCLRNNIQHLSGTIIKKFIEGKIPAWGTLNWVSKLEESAPFFIFSFVAGKVFERTTSFVNLVGRRITLPIGLITLSSDEEVCISDVVEVEVNRISKFLIEIRVIDLSSPPESIFASAEFTPS